MTPPKRMQTQSERDREGLAARKKRDQAYPVEIPDEITGRVDGDELDRLRSMREPEDRMARIEKKQDRFDREQLELKVYFAEELGGVRAEVGGLAGEVAGLSTLIKTAYPATVQVDTAKKMDKIAAKKSKRDFWFKIITAAVTGTGITEVLHRLGII